MSDVKKISEQIKISGSIKDATDRQMLLLAYGALQASTQKIMVPDGIPYVVEILSAYLFHKDDKSEA